MKLNVRNLGRSEKKGLVKVEGSEIKELNRDSFVVDILTELLPFL